MSIFLKVKAFFSSFSITATQKLLRNFKKLPSKNQWRQVLQVLTKKEKILLGSFFVLALSSLIFLIISFYFKNTEIKPAFGGTYTEGIIGQPRFINPIYIGSNDVDRDLVELIFSGLMKYDEKSQIVYDLAKDIKIDEEGKLIEVYLKENATWQDKTPLTADDVIFTIETIQNPDYKSPLRAGWLEVEVEKISDYTISFKLKNPYSVFLENLTLKILPKHIWQEIPPENFPLATFNLQPIGSGLYQFKKIKQGKLGYIKSLTLERNPNYFGKKPFISEITFYFFEKKEDLIEAAQAKKIKGLTLISPKNLKLLNEDFSVYQLSLPRYFAVFFNHESSKIFEEKEVKEALNYGTNKEEIIDNVLVSFGKVVNSPVLPDIYGFRKPLKTYEFNLEKAKEILDEVGFKVNEETGQREMVIEKEPAFQFKSDLRIGSKGTGVEKLQECLAKLPEIYPEGKITGYFGKDTKEAVIKFKKEFVPGTHKNDLVGKKTRAKLNELCFRTQEVLPLKFSLVTVDQPLLIEVANLLKNQWEVLGTEVEIKTFDSTTLERDIIKPRNYEALLFGEVLGLIPDPFPFWHSSQKKDPGLNLALYESKKADRLLEEARTSLDPEIQAQKYESFQDILIEDCPVVFLYNPDYLYLVSEEIKGINVKKIADPSKRFSEIENWYIRTKRVW